MIDWPTDRQEVMIQAFYFAGDDPYIYGVSGRINAYVISQIEKTMKEDADEIFKKGDGDYLLEAAFCFGDRDEYSGAWIHAPYWEISFIDFRQMDSGE